MNEWKVIRFALGYLATNYEDFEQEVLEGNIDSSFSEADIEALVDKTVGCAVDLSN